MCVWVLKDMMSILRTYFENVCVQISISTIVNTDGKYSKCTDSGCVLRIYTESEREPKNIRRTNSWLIISRSSSVLYVCVTHNLCLYCCDSSISFCSSEHNNYMYSDECASRSHYIQSLCIRFELFKVGATVLIFSIYSKRQKARF